jgi:hypothetical protein
MLLLHCTSIRMRHTQQADCTTTALLDMCGQNLSAAEVHADDELI